MNLTFLLVGFLALIVGLALGWLIGVRGGEKGKATAEALRLQLDGVRDERDTARVEVERIRSAHDVTARELATLHADARNFDVRMKDLQEFERFADRPDACGWRSTA